MNYDLDMCRKSARLWNREKKNTVMGFIHVDDEFFKKANKISKGKVKEKRGQPV